MNRTVPLSSCITVDRMRNTDVRSNSNEAQKGQLRRYSILKSQQDVWEKQVIEQEKVMEMLKHWMRIKFFCVEKWL